MHSGRLTLSDDSKTLFFEPSHPFSLGERVRVRFAGGIETLGGGALPPMAYSFSVATADPRTQGRHHLEFAELFPDQPSLREQQREFTPARPSDLTCDTLPPTYAPITSVFSNDPDPGDIFLTPTVSGATSGLLLITDNLGMPIFFRTMPYRCNDLKVQPNGLLTFYMLYQTISFGIHYALDTSYAPVDSFAAGNGYIADGHDFQILSNGHALVISYDPQLVNMSVIVPGGSPSAWVTGLIVQELDVSKHVVFQWRSWDHFQITDMVETNTRRLTDPVIDYVHGNAVEEDPDGNLLISCRHMNEITKIDRQTGDIIWRLGLNAKNNEFMFLNDTRGFSHQHDIRRIANGHITLFDNGNFLDPQYSRGLEYKLNEQGKVATLMWEYRNAPDIYGANRGNVQKREDGGAMIGWGGTSDPRKLTDLHADGSRALEFEFSPNTVTYRAFRFPWEGTRFVTSSKTLDFGAVTVGATAGLPLWIRNNAASALSITCFVSTDPSFSVAAAVPMDIPPGDSAEVEVQFTPTANTEFRGNLYVRSVDSTDVYSQAVAVSGLGSVPAGVANTPAAQLALGRVTPNPSSGAALVEFSVPYETRVRLRVVDVQGRLVAVLADGVYPAGRHQGAWDGRRRKGRAAPGLYFMHLEAAGSSLVRRFVLTR